MNLFPFQILLYPELATDRLFICKLLLVIPKEHLDRQEPIIDDLEPLFNPIQHRHTTVSQLPAV